jgi:hypothetical protein
MADHRRIRRLCQALDDAARWSGDADPGSMPGHVWERLAGLLEEHTRAEEEICYLPMLSRLPHATQCRQEAIADHDDIREAISEAALQRVGGQPPRTPRSYSHSMAHPGGNGQDGYPPGRLLAARPGRPAAGRALLLPAVGGALPAADPRTLATLSAVRDQLVEEEHV